MKGVLFMLVLLIFLPGFQAKKVETVSLSGAVESVNKDSKSFVVNGTTITLSSSTKIVDERGSPLKIENVKPRSSIAVEAIHHSHGILADRIIVKAPKRNP